MLIILWGGGINAADTSPTSLIVRLWIYTAHWVVRGTQRITNCTRWFLLSDSRVAAFLELTSLEPATSVWRVHRPVRGCHHYVGESHITPSRDYCLEWKQACGEVDVMTGTRGSGRWRRRWWWNTRRRKEAETYGRGCPAGGSQYVETMAPWTCFSSRRATFTP
jgi:hypothetical protein